MPAPISFDRIADRYDATRGGESRGRTTADALLPWLPEGPVVELGVGTGVVAAALAGHGRAPVGVDLSAPMLALAAERIPGLVVRGDVLRPPLRPRSAAAVVGIHVLHLVGDLTSAVTAAAALLRPGGRLLVSGIEGNLESRDDMNDIDRAVSARLRPFPPPAAEHIVRAGIDAGLRLVHDGHMARRSFEQTPAESAELLESRVWSWLWDVPDDIWEAEVVPVIAAMRALPDPERPRPRWTEFRYLVLEATP